MTHMTNMTNMTRMAQKVVYVLCDPAFPGYTGPDSVDAAGWEQAGAGLWEGAEVRLLKAEELGAALRSAAGGCYIRLHGPYFPKEAWPELLGFLRGGGSLIHVGGAPFKRPVRQVGAEGLEGSGGTAGTEGPRGTAGTAGSEDKDVHVEQQAREKQSNWIVEAEQTAYHQQLGIHEALPVQASSGLAYTASEERPVWAEAAGLLEPMATWNLVPHVTRSSDLPHQMGSAGPMDTTIHALVKGRDRTGRELSAPVVLWEHTKGPFAGTRWMFANQLLGSAFWNGQGRERLLQWASYCASGVGELWVKPGYAAYEAGERASVLLQGQMIGGPAQQWAITLQLSRADGSDLAPLWEQNVELEAGSELAFARLSIPLDLEPGLYELAAKAEARHGERRLLKQAFWCRDEQLLASGSRIRAGRDYFEQDGSPLPVVGMTYMTSDVARKFLFLPNVAVWERDMAQMKRAGINWIRTGIWTAYRNIMQVDGHASEEVLRAIDAFLLTAAKCGLQITFTFFSFTPETWEGVNPYLDPRSVEAQKRFVRAIVSRHVHTTHVDWDLINEPSMFDPVQIFSNGPRSCKDRYEREAFVSWLQERHGNIARLQESWNMTPDELPGFAAVQIPEAGQINFDVQDMHRAKKGGQWLDYVLFSMDMHNRWAGELYAAIKDLAPDSMVTVGQDEALGAQRPSPFFYGEAADYTTVHSWWLNDHLLWDGIFAKTLGKPNLVQETGIMYVETPDGRAKRTEEELRAILERKYAYAFAAGGAGAVQWIWNTNFYMDNANESHIGALRADGTEKPEADVSYQLGSFMAKIRNLFAGRRLERIAMVFPYSNDFSNRKLAFDATTQAVRVLAYQLKLPVRGVSEYHLEDLLQEPAALVIVPSPHNFDDGAFALLERIARETGATVLFTGPLGLDAYWHWQAGARLGTELGQRALGNVRREEMLRIGDKLVPLSYGARRIAEVAKETAAAPAGPSAGHAAAGADAVVTVPLGAGQFIWSPLPVELNSRAESVAELYRYAVEASGVEADLQWLAGGELAGVYGRKLAFEQGALFVFVSEYAHDVPVKVMDRGTGTGYDFVLQAERSVLFATDGQGAITAIYRPEEVQITDWR